VGKPMGEVRAKLHKWEVR